MKIALVTETYWPDINGVAMTLHRLVTGLAGRGHQVQLICPAQAQRDFSELPLGVYYCPIRGFPVPGYSQATFGPPSGGKLKQLWTMFKPDVIYVATEGPLGWSAVRMAKKIGLPVISGFHTNFQSYCHHYKIGFLSGLISRYLVAFHNDTLATIVPTDNQQTLLHRMGIANVTVMGRGVDTTLYSPTKRDWQLRRRWGAEKGDPVMIYVGRIAEEKNLAATMRAYEAMRVHNPRLKFVLVGDGPLREKLRAQHPELIMTGQLSGEDLASHYASADIFIFSSLTETFGNVVLEAMASGLGLLAYDYAAARLHVTSGHNGLLASFSHEEEFVVKAANLVKNELLLRKLRNNASLYAGQHGWDSIVDRFSEILQMQARRFGGEAAVRSTLDGNAA